MLGADEDVLEMSTRLCGATLRYAVIHRATLCFAMLSCHLLCRAPFFYQLAKVVRLGDVVEHATLRDLHRSVV